MQIFVSIVCLEISGFLQFIHSKYKFYGWVGGRVGALVADGRFEVKMLGWNTPPEYLAYVSPHWRSFEAPNPAYHYMLALLYIILFICSIVGNGCVMWIFAT